MKEQCSNCLHAHISKDIAGIITACRHYPPTPAGYSTSFPLVRAKWKCSLWEYYDLYFDGVSDNQYRPEYFKFKGVIQ